VALVVGVVELDVVEFEVDGGTEVETTAGPAT
jgi:hypothetical protein